MRAFATALTAGLLMMLSVDAQAAILPDDRTKPVCELLERIAPGISQKFVLERCEAAADFFEIESIDDKIVVRGRDNLCIATGIDWYLKYYAHIHLSWDGMTAPQPVVLPPVPCRERHEATVANRYAYNYCTFSYSMAFWDWERWEREIDWMALHGINRPLMAVGMEKVWQNLLRRLGYDDDAIDRFIAGPAFQAWWLMDNIEGWGNPSPEGWYDDRAELARKIVNRMRELDIEPVLPGYSGKLPSDAAQKLGLDVVDTGLWCGYTRPSFLLPEDPHFADIAHLYYNELHNLYGSVRYYSCDPFHEGGATEGVDLAASGHAIMDAMKRERSDAVWVIQAWQENPRPQMIADIAPGDLLVLDLFSESKPQWGETSSVWYRPEGFGSHNWVYCMLLNFGGNVGLHGKLQYVADGFYDALEDRHAGKTLAGTGMTPEGIENNPVMFELLTELAWRSERFSTDEWLDRYVTARYGRQNDNIRRAWSLLAHSVYAAPKNHTQEGTHESVFCSRPVWDYHQTSRFAATKDYYDPCDVIEAAQMMVAAADDFTGNNHYEYDLVDIVRQAIAEIGRIQQRRVADAHSAGDNERFANERDAFLRLILLQDRLLGTRSEFMVGRRIEEARSLGRIENERQQLEWNAKVQITTWGDRNAAERGGLIDYAHKEWNGLLSTLYYERWERWFNEGDEVDFYDMESRWASDGRRFCPQPEGDPVQTAKETLNQALDILNGCKDAHFLRF